MKTYSKEFNDGMANLEESHKEAVEILKSFKGNEEDATKEMGKLAAVKAMAAGANIEMIQNYTSLACTVFALHILLAKARRELVITE